MPTTIQVSDHMRRRLRALQKGTGKSCDQVIWEALKERLGVPGSPEGQCPSPAGSGETTTDGAKSPALPTRAELNALDDLLNFVVDYVQWRPEHDDEALRNKVELVNALMTKIERLRDEMGGQAKASDADEQ